MTAEQKVLFEYLGTNYVFTVSQAVVEGQENSRTLERGMISDDTYIVFEASRDSNIKVTFVLFATDHPLLFHFCIKLISFFLQNLNYLNQWQVTDMMVLSCRL